MITIIKNLFVGIWRTISRLFLFCLGMIRLTRRFPWIIIEEVPYDVSGRMTRECERMLRPGDILLRRIDGAILNWFIPGRYTHSAIYVGNGIVIHALGDGVQQTDLIDFLRCDGFAILRCNKNFQSSDGNASVCDNACRIAKSYLGYDYDYDLNVCEDYRNKDEVTKRTKSVYCHELVRSCYPTLDIPTIMPSIWNGMIKSKKRQFLSQSFIESPDFDLVYDSYYSVIRGATYK